MAIKREWRKFCRQTFLYRSRAHYQVVRVASCPLRLYRSSPACRCRYGRGTHGTQLKFRRPLDPPGLRRKTDATGPNDASPAASSCGASGGRREMSGRSHACLRQPLAADWGLRLRAWQRRKDINHITARHTTDTTTSLLLHPSHTINIFKFDQNQICSILIINIK